MIALILAMIFSIAITGFINSLASKAERTTTKISVAHPKKPEIIPDSLLLLNYEKLSFAKSEYLLSATGVKIPLRGIGPLGVCLYIWDNSPKGPTDIYAPSIREEKIKWNTYSNFSWNKLITLFPHYENEVRNLVKENKEMELLLQHGDSNAIDELLESLSNR